MKIKLHFPFLAIFYLFSFSIEGSVKGTNVSCNPEVSFLKNQVVCPFAKASKIWKNESKWASNVTVETNTLEFIEHDLKPFVQLARNGDFQFDGIAIAVPERPYAVDLASFAEFLRRVLFTIDPEGITKLQRLKPDVNGRFLDDGWQFSFENIRMFVVTIAPFYCRSSSRSSFGSDFAFILFQTEASFREHLSKNSDRRARQKEGIRKTFETKGQKYFPCSTIENRSEPKLHEAPRYIKPLNPLDPPVTWWLENSSISFDSYVEYDNHEWDFFTVPSCSLL